MSSAQRKMRRTVLDRRERLFQRSPVLIIRPHHRENLTDEHTSQWLSFNRNSRIADEIPYASQDPEDARNRGIEAFLHDEKWNYKSHLFFLDDDSPPLEADAIVKLLRHRKPIVCAPTPIFRYDGKHEHITLYWNTEGMLEGHTEANPRVTYYQGSEIPRRLFKVYRTGGTGMLIRRDVLERLSPPYQKAVRSEETNALLLSEDLYFCNKLRQAGFTIWADGNTVCRHFHRLDILDVLALELTIRHGRQDPFCERLCQLRAENALKESQETEILRQFLETVPEGERSP